MNLGERVRAARAKLSWSQERLASEAGVTKLTVLRLETGKSAPTLKTLRAVAKALGRRLDTLTAEPRRRSS